MRGDRQVRRCRVCHCKAPFRPGGRQRPASQQLRQGHRREGDEECRQCIHPDFLRVLDVERCQCEHGGRQDAGSFVEESPARDVDQGDRHRSGNGRNEAHECVRRLGNWKPRVKQVIEDRGMEPGAETRLEGSRVGDRKRLVEPKALSAKVQESKNCCCHHNCDGSPGPGCWTPRRRRYR